MNIKTKLWLLVALLGVVSVLINTKQTIEVEITPTPSISPTPSPTATPVPTIKQIIELAAEKHGADYSKMLAVANCESGLKPYAIGDGGDSIGLFQIHLPSHPSVSREEALDPHFAADWSAKKFAAGFGNIWTCYRQIYG